MTSISLFFERDISAMLARKMGVVSTMQ